MNNRWKKRNAVPTGGVARVGKFRCCLAVAALAAIAITFPTPGYCSPANLQQTAVANSLQSFHTGAATYRMTAESQNVGVFTIYAPDLSAIYHTRSMQLEPKGYLVFIRGSMPSADDSHAKSNPAAPATDADLAEGTLAQFRCAADGSVLHRKFFLRPAGSCGRIGLSPDEAARTAGLEGRTQPSEARLLETSPYRFFWEFQCGKDKCYVDAHSGTSMTEQEMFARTMPGLSPTPPPPWTPTGTVYYKYENNALIPVEMQPDALGAVMARGADEEACRSMLASCAGVFSCEKVVPPSPHGESPNAQTIWFVWFKNPVSAADLEQTARNLSAQPGIEIACPVFRQQDVSGSVFEFIFTYALRITVNPAGVPAVDEMLRQREGVQVLNTRQTAFHTPVRYVVRVNPSLISLAELIDFANRIHDAGNVKFVGLTQLIVHHPTWDTLEAGDTK